MGRTSNNVCFNSSETDSADLISLPGNARNNFVPSLRSRHGRDHKLHVWKTLEDVPATSKIGGSAVTPEAQALTLWYSMDVNALNYCRFSLLGLRKAFDTGALPPGREQDHSEAERSSEHRSQCLIALPNLVESSLVIPTFSAGGSI